MTDRYNEGVVPDNDTENMRYIMGLLREREKLSEEQYIILMERYNGLLNGQRIPIILDLVRNPYTPLPILERCKSDISYMTENRGRYFDSSRAMADFNRAVGEGAEERKKLHGTLKLSVEKPPQEKSVWDIFGWLKKK